ncbi:MAG: hypothetical protein OXC31_06425 [Spirochaetaceae bacterium]|nr:hypothetical protein [Spirochaetaceae bacterium]
MAAFDLKTPKGLRDACREAERRLQQDSESVGRNAGFLQRVQEATGEERETVDFMRLLWEENLLYELSNAKAMNVSIAIYNSAFPRPFLELIDGPLPEDVQKRTKELDDRMDKARELAWPSSPVGSTVMTTRTFAALFPHDFTTHRSPGRKGRLFQVLSGDKNVRDEAWVNRWLLDHMDEAVGPVDRSDWNAVARRMMLPDILFEIAIDSDSQQRRTSRPEPPAQPPDPPPPVDRPELSHITEHFESIRKAGRLIFEREMVESLHLGLWARARRHFAVLTGLSGTGKTLLAVEYAKALTGKDSESTARICTIAVQPGWYDPTPLLGYVNPLGENQYTKTEFVRFLIRATKNPSQPHVCVLDEMNLSHPEQYLAPILSAMEVDGETIELHGGDAKAHRIPRIIPYPHNLVLIGTLNMDETTLGISDKVLDRAFTLEFWDVNVEQWPGWKSAQLVDQDAETVKEILKQMMDALSPARLHFGWRVIEEVVRFMEQRQKQTAGLTVDHALDRVLYAKVLPKLRGDDSPRFRKALADCRAALNERNLTRSIRKVEELIEDMAQTGSFRFWR